MKRKGNFIINIVFFMVVYFFIYVGYIYDCLFIFLVVNNGCLFIFRQVKVVGKDLVEEDFDKIELECVRKIVFCIIDMDIFF